MERRPIPTALIRDRVLARGWAFAAIQYRLSGEAPWPAQLGVAERLLVAAAADLEDAQGVVRDGIQQMQTGALPRA